MIIALMPEAQLYDGSPQPVPSGRPRHSAPRQLGNEYHSHTGLRADLLKLLEGNCWLFDSQSFRLREGSFKLLPGIRSSGACVPRSRPCAATQQSPVVGLETGDRRKAATNEPNVSLNASTLATPKNSRAFATFSAAVSPASTHLLSPLEPLESHQASLPVPQGGVDPWISEGAAGSSPPGLSRSAGISSTLSSCNAVSCVMAAFLTISFIVFFDVPCA